MAGWGNKVEFIMMIRRFDLENRLLEFALSCIEISERLSKPNIISHLSKQLVRSATSPTLNYADVCAAELKKDFRDKLKIANKELRETFDCLKIIQNKPLLEENRTESVLNV